MTQVSKYPISKDVYERIFDIFLRTLAGFKNKKQVTDFIEDFLTPTERVMLAKRFAIAFLLNKGYSYREISLILRVSISTIGFVSLDLNTGSNFKKVIDKTLRNEDIDKYIENSVKKVVEALSVSSSKNGSWKYLRNEIESKRRKKPF